VLSLHNYVEPPTFAAGADLKQLNKKKNE